MAAKSGDYHIRKVYHSFVSRSVGLFEFEFFLSFFLSSFLYSRRRAAVGYSLILDMCMTRLQCLFMCRDRWSLRENDLAQRWHLKGLDPVCFL